MINDPSGILGRIPELEPIAEEPSIRKAIEGGDPFKIYRALFWARLLGKIRSHREVLDAVLANRRLFARPLKGVPSLSTVNSVGTGFVGSSEEAPDGTHIATHAIVVLFKIPLLPLGAYVVRHAEGSSWNIFVRVPLGTLPWLYSRAIALGAIASVLVAGAAAFHASRHHELRIVNAFSKSVQVTIGKEKRTVPARGDDVFELPTGRYEATAETEAGVQVDKASLEVSTSPDQQIWNLAGAAPLFLLDIHYGPSSSPTRTAPPKPTTLCGQKLIKLSSVDYAFREPEKSVSLPKGSGGVTKQYLDYQKADGDLTRLCYFRLLEAGRAAESLPALGVAAEVEGWKGDAAGNAIAAAVNLKDGRALEWAKKARDADPTSIEANRHYQDAAKSAGKEAEAVAEYKQRAEAADSADAWYLYARLLHGEPYRTLTDRLAARFPDHAWLQRALVWSRSRVNDWDGVAKAAAKLRSLSPEVAEDTLPLEVRALVATGDKTQALRLLRTRFEGEKAGGRLPLALLFARVSKGGGAPADELIERLEKENEGDKLWLLRQQSGLPVPDDVPGVGLSLERLTARDPAAALKASAGSGPQDVARIEPDTWTLLFSEAARTRDGKAEAALLKAPKLPADDLEALRGYARGEPVNLDDFDLPPEQLAAAALVRSRNPSLPESERQSLRAQAKRLDVLQGPVTAALASWKP